MIRVTYIISSIDRSLAFEWIVNKIDKKKISLSFILLNTGDSELEKFLKSSGIPVYRTKYTGKKDTVNALLAIRKILKTEDPHIVHTHLFEASVIGLSAARTLGIKRRIYTRHHSTYHHSYHPQAVKYDRLCNFLSTDIVAISKNVENVLAEKEKVIRKKIHLIHHGFDLAAFGSVSPDDQSAMVKKYNPRNASPVIGVIARQTEWKGIQFIIPAFRKLLNEYPQALLLLANAGGNYREKIKEMLSTIPQRNYLEIPFERDIISLYSVFDLFVHVPIDPHCEAFGQTYIEALAAGIPSVFTLSGVAPEFIEHEKNALVVPFCDSDAVYKALYSLLNDAQLQARLSTRGKMDVVKYFYLDKMIRSLEALYVS